MFCLKGSVLAASLAMAIALAPAAVAGDKKDAADEVHRMDAAATRAR